MPRQPLPLLLLALLPAVARPEEMIRVAVEVGVARVGLEGEALAVGVPGPGAEEPGAPAEGRAVRGGRAEIRAGRDGGLTVDGEPWPGPVAVFSSPGAIRAGGRPLHGWVEVRRVPSGLAVVEALPMDDYVAGVVAGETPPSFPPEARRAQAVAARTYALVRKLDALNAGRGWDLTATVVSQVFAGAAAADPGAVTAAQSTRGEVLVLGQEPVETYFHSSCGGRTEDGLEALGRGYEYLRSVPCGGCDGAPGSRWQQVLTAEELGRAARLGAPATAVRVVARTRTGRAARVEIAAGRRRVTLGGADLRQRLGWSRLRSLAFEVAPAKGAFAFDGRGAGHGAGLCQWGAAGLAREGKGYREILAHYYPGTEVTVLY